MNNSSNAFVTSTLPSYLPLENVTSSTTAADSYNDVVIPTNLVVAVFALIIYLTLGIRLWRSKALSSVIVLRTKHSSDNHPFLVTVVTSYLRGSASISPRISFVIVGSESTSGEFKVTGRHGLKEKPFQKGKLDYFYLTGPDDLGVLEQIEIKQRGPDCWYVTRVSVQDLETKIWYRCNVGKWLTAKDGEEQTYQFPLESHFPPDGLLRYVLYYFKENIGDMHIWLSLTQWQCPSYMPSFGRFLLVMHFISSYMFFAIIFRYFEIYYGIKTGFGLLLLSTISMWTFEMLLRLTQPRKIRKIPVRTVRSRDLLNTTLQSTSTSMNSICASAGIVKLPFFPSDLSNIAHVTWEQDDVNKENKCNSTSNLKLGAEKEMLIPEQHKTEKPLKSSLNHRPVPPPPLPSKTDKNEMNGNVVVPLDGNKMEKASSFNDLVSPTVQLTTFTTDDRSHQNSSIESVNDVPVVIDTSRRKSLWGKVFWDPLSNVYGRLSGALKSEPEEVVVEMKRMPKTGRNLSIHSSLTASDIDSFYTARNSWVSEDRSVSFASFPDMGSMPSLRPMKIEEIFDECDSIGDISNGKDKEYEGPVFCTYMLESELLDLELEARNSQRRLLPHFVHYIWYIILPCNVLVMCVLTGLYGVGLSKDKAVSWLISIFYAIGIEASVIETIKLLVSAFLSYFCTTYNLKCGSANNHIIMQTSTTSQ